MRACRPARAARPEGWRGLRDASALGPPTYCFDWVGVHVVARIFVVLARGCVAYDVRSRMCGTYDVCCTLVAVVRVFRLCVLMDEYMRVRRLVGPDKHETKPASAIPRAYGISQSVAYPILRRYGLWYSMSPTDPPPVWYVAHGPRDSHE